MTPSNAITEALNAYHVAIDQTRWDDARQIVRRLRKGGLDPATFLRLMAGLEIKEGRPDSAWTRLQASLRTQPTVDLPLIRLWHGLARTRLDESARARQLDAWIAQQDEVRRSPSVWLMRGNLALQQGQLKPASAALRRGCLAWIDQPEQDPVAPPAHATDSSASAEPALYRLLVAARQAGLVLIPTGGTLLGLERNGHLLPGDKDADLYCMTDQAQTAINWLVGQGWRPIPARPALANYFSFSHPDFPLALDLFPLIREEGRATLLAGCWLADGKREEGRFTRQPIQAVGTRSTPFGDICYPAEPAALLTTIYGDWRTPDPDFDTMIMAHHLVAFTPLVASFAYQRLLNALLAGKYAKARRLAQHLHNQQIDLDLWPRLQARLAQATPNPSDAG